MELKPGANSVHFKSQGLQLAGDLYTPDNFDPSASYPAIVFAGPFNQVKEQMGAVYGKKLSSKGYVFLTFDHRGYGDSEGDVRNNEKFDWKQEGIRDAISYVRTLPFIDREKLYGLGGCAGGGYVALVAVTDKRLKAIASVSGVMNPQAMFFEAMTREQLIPMFQAANESRQRQYESGEVEYADGYGYEGIDPNTLADGARREGYEYYMTDRAGTSRYPHFSIHTVANLLEDQPMTNPTAWAPYLYTPYLGIYGEKAMGDTGPLTVAYHAVCSEPKELFEVPGASHVSLYDIDQDVDRAVDRIDKFFRKY
ncbi:alpha/beta hydrolase [Fulvivirgaceae bacterium BMA12]|uniref:Alpha/beta hydrolase n=1 Tax=Agaribacillus aureus TaxID=3051825 RepID=A0ABT8KYG3_9BACT|nr:alpha/beta hydrolase [Fulvivirgaceae bacterium BMA12]